MRKVTDCVTKGARATAKCEKKTNLLVYKKECKDQSKLPKTRYIACRKKLF